jgi:hypothetical protein
MKADIEMTGAKSGYTIKPIQRSKLIGHGWTGQKAPEHQLTRRKTKN